MRASPPARPSASLFSPATGWKNAPNSVVVVVVRNQATIKLAVSALSGAIA